MGRHEGKSYLRAGYQDWVHPRYQALGTFTSHSSLFRHSRSMVTLDESGKALIFFSRCFEPRRYLTDTAPRVVRTTEKQDFVKILDRKLWTAARADQLSALTHRLPIIRVFDLFNSASTGTSQLPTEHTRHVR